MSADHKIPIGIDFGTTNTTVCIALPDGGGGFKVECLKFNETEKGGDDYVPTVVLYDERPNPDGSAKPPVIGSKAMRPLLRGLFNGKTQRLCMHGKFLLGEESRGEAHWAAYLAANPQYASSEKTLHYDVDQYRPSRVVRDFFKVLFEEICAHHLVRSLLKKDKERADLNDLAVVVTCPEAWKHSLGLPLNDSEQSGDQGETIVLQANPHPFLKNILEKDLGLKSIEIKSEPEAATVYFARQYAQDNANKLFSGQVMVVDYGGGTLDICLSNVTPQDGAIIITPEGGGHHAADGRFVAGVRFDEKVFELAWQDAGRDMNSFDELKSSSAFQKYMELIDEQKRRDWQETTACLRDHMLGISTEDIDLLGLEVSGTDLRVTTDTYVRAFNEANLPALKTCLEAYNEKLGEKGKRKKLSKEAFRLLLVGGFSRLELVRRHVIEHFGWDPDDSKESRVVRFQSQEADTAFAIAKGAALLAARWARVEGRMRYSVGLVAFEGNPNNPPKRYPALSEGTKFVEVSQWQEVRDMEDAGQPVTFDFLPGGMSVEAYIQQGSVVRHFNINMDSQGKLVEAREMMPKGECKQVQVKFRYDETDDGVIVRFEDAGNAKHYKEYPIQDLINRVFHQSALSKKSAT